MPSLTVRDVAPVMVSSSGTSRRATDGWSLIVRLLMLR